MAAKRLSAQRLLPGVGVVGAQDDRLAAVHREGRAAGHGLHIGPRTRHRPLLHLFRVQLPVGVRAREALRTWKPKVLKEI